MLTPRVQTTLKTLIPIGLGLYLLSRIVTGTLYYYINNRFMLLVIVGCAGLFLLGFGYWLARRIEGEHHLQHTHGGDHDHGHSHSPPLTLATVALLSLPIVLGFGVPAQPLGTAAMANREVNLDLSAGSAIPAAVRAGTAKPAAAKNLLDWHNQLRSTADPVEEMTGQPVKVTGFVFRDERFAPQQFMVTRYTVSCCVADASIVGLVVEWPDAASLALDQWVEVDGIFASGQFAGAPYPVVVADSITEVAIPNQPYLFP
jgi:uncharacterized repeat protein (TIGR03943 family)